MARDRIIFFLSNTFIVSLVNGNNQSWYNVENCLNLYKPSPFGKDGIPVSKLYWDSGIITSMDNSIKSTVVDHWPEPMERRKTPEEYLKALGYPRPAISETSTIYSFGRNEKNHSKFEWRDISASMLQIHEIHPGVDNFNKIFNGDTSVTIDKPRRSLYLNNLKSASSTIGGILSRREETLRKCTSLSSPHKQHYLTEISDKECNGKCLLTCDGRTEKEYMGLANAHSTSYMKASDIPDEILENYLVFSFVRDPMTRTGSSYQQVTNPVDKFTFADHLRGFGKQSRNIHYRPQVQELLGCQSQSGKRMKLDFVGKIEDFEYDWNRLQYAMTPEAVKLSVKKRLALIPPPKTVGVTKEMKDASIQSQLLPLSSEQEAKTHVRPGRGTKGNHQPGNPDIEYLPYTVEQELDICRRYLQDFICFDFGIPNSCVKYAKEVYMDKL